MKILAIESSCDETACAILSSCDEISRSSDSKKQSFFEEDDADISGSHSEPETAAAVLKNDELLSSVVVSQIDIFKSYGGVIPEVAARSHLEAILPVIDKAMNDAHVTWNDITHLAVTHTPGLLGSLLIGTLTARTLAILHNKPLYAVHHLKSHIYSNWLSESSRRGENCSENGSFSPARTTTYIPDGTEKVARNEQSFPDSQCMTSSAESGDPSRNTRPQALEDTTPVFPLLALVISGGHTQIIKMTAHDHFDIIGTTLDDAVGECFDKIAKILGLEYPGGPNIAKAAEHGNPEKYKFPHPKTENPLDFSFSGLKTAVLRAIQKDCGVALNYPSHDLKNLLTKKQIADFAASFQKTAINILLEKLQTALEQHPDTKSIVFAGGVSANQALRDEATKKFENIFFPAPKYSGDNAAMVAEACYWEIKSGKNPTDPYKLTLAPRSNLC